MKRNYIPISYHQKDRSTLNKKKKSQLTFCGVSENFLLLLLSNECLGVDTRSLHLRTPITAPARLARLLRVRSELNTALAGTEQFRFRPAPADNNSSRVTQTKQSLPSSINQQHRLKITFKHHFSSPFVVFFFSKHYT